MLDKGKKKKVMRRSILILGLLLTSSLVASAQDENEEMTTSNGPITYFLPHHIGINLGGGIHTMMTDPLNGHSEKGFGGLFEARYEWLPKKVGIGAGLKLSLKNAATTANFSTQSTYFHPDNTMNCHLTTTFTDLHEKERMVTFEVPVQLIICTGTQKPWNFHAGVGATFSLPIGGKYEVDGGLYTTKGKFDQTYDVEYLYGIYGHGFGTTNANNIEKDKIEYSKIGVNANVDLGVLRNLTDQYALYLGIYGSYGILNACTQSDAPLFDGNTYTGLYNSDQVSKITPIEGGVKVGMYFTFHDTKREIEETNKILDERVESERQAAEASAAERATRMAEKGRQQELEKIQQERKNAELAAMNEASKQEAKEALKAIKESAKYANVNASPIFPKEADQHFLIVRKYLQANPDAKIIITGHTDNSSTPAKNIINGQHRAEAFKNALVKKNIPRNRIGCVSKGETEPIASNDTEEGRKQNRRVEIDLVDDGVSSVSEPTINSVDEDEND